MSTAGFPRNLADQVAEALTASDPLGAHARDELTDKSQAATHGKTFPGETDEYRRARDDLLRAEIELRAQTEAVTSLRRGLPLGGEVPTDYAFKGWDDKAHTVSELRLSELFGEGMDTLFLYSFMFIPGAKGLPLLVGCPSGTSIIDAIDGQVPHITQRMSFAVEAKAPIERFQAHARTRGWRHARLLSSADATYRRDYNAEAGDGQQLPMATVFVRRDSQIRLFGAASCFSLLRSRDRIPAMSTSCGHSGQSSTASQTVAVRPGPRN